MKKLFLLLSIFTILGTTPLFTMPVIGISAVYAEDPSPDLQDPYFMFNLRSITHEDVKEEKWIRKGINFIFERAITIMAVTVGSAAVLMITVGGFMILASGGRQDWVDKGKSFITKSLIGLAVTLGAYILVTTIQLLIKSIYG